jgi:hypothetical protein
MTGILVVAFLVHCGQSLLLCEDIDTRDLAFADMGECREQLGGLVAEEQQRKGAARVVMGKCRYLLVDPPRETAVARAGAPRRFSSYAAAVAADGGESHAD